MTKTDRLRQLLSGSMVLAPGVYNALSALIVERTGFDAMYMTGFGTAARLGMPDVGLVTLSEMVENVRYICTATSIPLIADADTAYGNPLNAIRTIGEYERAGAAGAQIEDQVFPKKCGYFAGKDVIPQTEFIQKLRAALDARTDPNFAVIARTDALAVNGWEDTVRRANAYYEAGADLVFVDGIKTRDDLDNYARRLASTGLPCLYNGRLVPAKEAKEMGFRVQILPGITMTTVYNSFATVLTELKNKGSIAGLSPRPARAPDGETLNDLLGLPQVYEMERRYGVGPAAK
ncbi:MAG: isocitrate lyase/PEP mutase family protein [Dehalococcoidia bacterium]|nr:isocitrate lyase/PEP mutase family protein [Dehalococcoidia bacterium]